jgi:hypothetical protein
VSLVFPSDEPLGEDRRVSYNAGLLRSSGQARGKQVVKPEDKLEENNKKQQTESTHHPSITTYDK